MNFPHPSEEGFWGYIQERETIRIRRKEGLPPPWTEDKILQEYHFCNIRREDDYGTRWYLREVVPLTDDYGLDTIWRTVIYRLVNNVDYFERLSKLMSAPVGIFGIESWRNPGARRKIISALEHNGAPFTPAHIILQSPRPTSRLYNLMESIGYLYENIGALTGNMRNAETLKEAWSIIQEVPYVGPFIALQICRDLVLAGFKEWDENKWCYVGPGARLGLEMLMGFEVSSQIYQLKMSSLYVNQPDNVGGISEINLCDIEHNLCEAAKFWKISQGRGRRRKYKPHARV